MKIENSLNDLNNKIEETLDNMSLYKNETSEKFNEINKKFENLEPELVNKIIEKEKKNLSQRNFRTNLIKCQN